MAGKKKPWIINCTTEKDGEYKGWGMYLMAEDISSAIQKTEELIRMNPEEYDRYVITDAGLATDVVPKEEKWRENWSTAKPEDFE